MAGMVAAELGVNIGKERQHSHVSLYLSIYLIAYLPVEFLRQVAHQMSTHLV